MLEVEPETPYDNDYNSMLSRAQAELAAIRQGDYPSIKTSDVFTLSLVALPMWLLYEASILLVDRVNKQTSGI